MGFRLVFDMPFGIKGINRELTRISDAAKDMRPAWEHVIAIWVKGNERTFVRGQTGGWDPLSPGYAAWKARHYPGRPILVRTGALYASLTTKLDVLQVGPTRMVAGSSSTYGRYHQTGAGPLPARPPIVVVEADRRAMVKAVQAHLMGSATAGVRGPGVVVL